MSGSGDQSTITVAIVTPFEPELVELIRDSRDHVEVLYEPDLLPPVRYPGDHGGVAGFTREAGAERRWRRILERAEVFLGLPGDSAAGLARAVRSNPGLRWVQATAAGAGEQLRAAALTPKELERVTVTTASGVHAGPLAEFCILGLRAARRSTCSRRSRYPLKTHCGICRTSFSPRTPPRCRSARTSASCSSSSRTFGATSAGSRCSTASIRNASTERRSHAEDLQLTRTDEYRPRS